MRAGGPVGAIVEVDEEVAVDLHATVGVAVDPQEPGAHVRIELVVPGGVQRVGDVESTAVEGELKHVGAAVQAAAGVVGLAEHPAEPQLAGQPGFGRVGHVVLTNVAVQPVGEVEVAVVHRQDEVADNARHRERPAFELKGRWENGGTTPPFNYDFWYQPRKNALVSSEFGAPNAYENGFDPADVEAGHYGHRLHFWNLADRTLEQTLDLGENGLLPFEVRLKHDPDAEEGFVGAALSSTMWHFHRNGSWQADKVIAVESVELDGWPFPVPGVISDLVLSMDDRFLYFANWLHGDVRQYDVSDPANPKLTGQLWLGGVLGKPDDTGRNLNGGPNMLQLSYDGRRLYVSNSLYSTWDNQFYPGLRSWLLRVNCNPAGGMEVDGDFFVDFHDRPAGPARAHEVRLQGGDCTTEIFQ